MSKFETIQNEVPGRSMKMRQESKFAEVIQLEWFEVDGQRHERWQNFSKKDSHGLAGGLSIPYIHPQSALIVSS